MDGIDIYTAYDSLLVAVTPSPVIIKNWEIGCMLQLIIVLSIAGLVGIDQLTKWLAIVHLKEKPPFLIIDQVFELTYLENTGAAFGLGKDQAWMRWIFIVLTFLILIVLTVVLMSGRYRRYKLVNISGILIIAGGIGNMIDRLVRGYVVDFLYFRLIDFPVFNFADCCVVIGAILLLIFLFFIYSDEKQEAAPKAAAESVQNDLEMEAGSSASSIDQEELDSETADFDAGPRDDGGTA